MDSWIQVIDPGCHEWENINKTRGIWGKHKECGSRPDELRNLEKGETDER
jgi:hypothetical protein